ncbi:MAG: sulfatase-like hydrolase/transferase [Alphaproteobacteria bacterium]|nr:sulfatase-like hydrolase/transferase [Alphaproteobacteria bacterium]
MSVKQPNILFVLTDQQRLDSMAAYGNRWIDARHMDALAARSFVFENCYCTQPVCTPSRGSLMTGLYPHATGVVRNRIPLPADTPSLGELMPDDYYNAHMGKWHLGDDVIAQRGFDTWIAIEDFHRRDYSKKEYRNIEPAYNDWLREHGVEPPPWTTSYEAWAGGAGLTEEQTQAGFLGHVASKFIRDYPSGPNTGKPWLLQVNFFEPHPPYTGPLNDLYDHDAIEVGPAFMQRPDTGSLVNRLRADFYLGGGNNPLGLAGGDAHDTTSEAGWRKLRTQYFANVTLVDRQLGKILAALEETGQADNTIIVFSSDHGEMAGDHGMCEKRNLYEEASRVPLLIHVPWLNKGASTRIPGSISHVDILPTLLEFAGAESLPNIHGTSRTGVLRGEADLGTNDVFVEWDGMGDRNLGSPEINRMVSMPWRSVITPERYKLNLSPGDQCELYDLNSDAHEMKNLYDDPAHRDRVRDMAARIRMWQAATADTLTLPAA